MWEHTGSKRPLFAATPGSGQESVWDYPRPPRLVADERHIVVRFRDIIVADTVEAYRVLETASPPTFYIPPKDVRAQLLQPFPGTSECEWKGAAKYWSLKVTPPLQQAIGWSYPAARVPYAQISGYCSFYPGRVACFVDDEHVRPQPGFFYGGWVTNEIVGPWKGEAGTERW